MSAAHTSKSFSAAMKNAILTLSHEEIMLKYVNSAAGGGGYVIIYLPPHSTPFG
jgi:hypothetical protein